MKETPIIPADIRPGMRVRATNGAGTIVEGTVTHAHGGRISFEPGGRVFVTPGGWNFIHIEEEDEAPVTDPLPLQITDKQWLDAHGRLFELCVLHKLDPEQKEEAQAMSVVGGLSLCEEHMNFAVGLTLAGVSIESIMEMQMQGELMHIFDQNTENTPEEGEVTANGESE